MSNPIPFRVRPGYQSTDLLIEFMGDQRKEGFPDVASLLSEALNSTQRPHPHRLDRLELVMHDTFITYWIYAGGSYEVDDDFGGLFIHAEENNKTVLSEIERVLIETGLFAKEAVDFAQFR